MIHVSGQIWKPFLRIKKIITSNKIPVILRKGGFMDRRILVCLCITMIFISRVLVADAGEMLSVINWEVNAEDAFSKAKATGKPVLMDFFSPT